MAAAWPPTALGAGRRGRATPSLVLLDVWLHGSPMDGLEVLDEIKKREPELPVIIFSGHGNIDTAVSAISRGAMDFLEKPFEAERLLLLVERATETERLRRENQRLRQGFVASEEFTGNSAAINQVRATLKRVANTGSRLLITGPAGSGKEVAARLLHSWSPRAQNAFITVNSARITPNASSRNCSARKPMASWCAPAFWKWPMAARCSSMKWPTCRHQARRASCAC
jgi:DNA-binding NtrC family response regulator